MTGYLARLADHAVGRRGGVRPRVPARFELSPPPDEPPAVPTPGMDPPVEPLVEPPLRGAAAPTRLGVPGTRVEAAEARPDESRTPQPARAVQPVRRGTARANPAPTPVPHHNIGVPAAIPDERPPPSDVPSRRTSRSLVRDLAIDRKITDKGETEREVEGRSSTDSGARHAPSRRADIVEPTLDGPPDPSTPRPRTEVPGVRPPEAADATDAGDGIIPREPEPGWTTDVTRTRRRASAAAAGGGRDEPAITVSIGRVEVRAPAPEPRGPARRGPRAPATAPRLADYLRTRRERE